MTSVLRIAVAVALLASAAPVRADEAQDQNPEPEQVGVPAPENADQMTANEQPTGTPPPASGTPSYVTEEVPVEAVHRPGGVWGALAVAADVLVMRPIGFISLAPAAAAAVIVSPVTAATQTIPDATGTITDRAKDVFTRPLGAL
jgi:hypothetical protein